MGRKESIKQTNKQTNLIYSLVPQAGLENNMSAGIYEWKLDKGKWKFTFACRTGRVDFFVVLVIVCEKNTQLTSVYYILQSYTKIIISFRYDCGTGVGILSSQTTARMGEWNLIRILRDGNDASLQLNDAETVNGTSPVSSSSVIKCASTWENLYSGVWNNKGADQPAHPRRLISAFVIHLLESIISQLASSEISIF